MTFLRLFYNLLILTIFLIVIKKSMVRLHHHKLLNNTILDNCNIENFYFKIQILSLALITRQGVATLSNSHFTPQGYMCLLALDFWLL